MGKIEKKKAKMQERIALLEEELKSALGKKTHDTAEINVPEQLRKINELKKTLATM